MSIAERTIKRTRYDVRRLLLKDVRWAIEESQT